MRTTRFTVAMPRPETHLYEITMEVDPRGATTLDLVLPVWTPGSYLEREFARRVDLAPAGLFTEAQAIRGMGDAVEGASRDAGPDGSERFLETHHVRLGRRRASTWKIDVEPEAPPSARRLKKRWLRARVSA